MRAARLERLRVAQEAAEAAQKAGSEDNPGKALLAAIFGAIDVDGSGTLSAAELKGALEGVVGPDMTLSWEWLDADGDGQLTCDEFCYGTLSAHVMEGEDEAATAVVADLNEVLRLIKENLLAPADEPADADAPPPDPEAAAAAKEAAAEASASAKERGAELLGKVYAQIDVNKSGSISASELKAALGAHSAELTLDWLDASGDGALTKEEFIEGALQNFGVIEELMEQAPIFAKLRTALEGVRAAVDDDLAARTAMGADAPAAAIQRRASFGVSRSQTEEEAAVPRVVNAFCVTIFCMDEAFESRAKDFLPAAFAAYPDREFCVVTLPHTTPEFALLNHFTQAEALPSSSFGHAVYLYHRDALIGMPTVRRAAAADRAALLDLVDGLDEAAEIVAAFDGATAEAAEGPVAAFVAELSEQLVGVVTVATAVATKALQAGYQLEDFILFSEHQPAAHVGLKHFVLNPIFSRASRFVLREIFRQLQASCVYYALDAGAAVPPILSELVQIRPRQQPTLSPALLSELAEQRGVDADPQPEPSGALYFLTRKLISEPKIVNNARVVVVGASDTALALLESLLTVPYLQFASLYLVAPHARAKLLSPRGGDGSDPSALPSFLARTSTYTAAELSKLALGARVRIVDARIADIERQRKAVVLPDDSILPYDHLVLAPELGDASFVALGPEAAGVRGAFSLCDDDAIASAALYLDGADAAARAGAAVVYGAGVDAYAALAALIARGVAPEKLVLVLPAGAPTDAFGHAKIGELVAAKLKELGVTIRRNLRLVGLESDDNKALSAALLEQPRASPNAPANVTALPCTLLVCCAARELDAGLFRAINSNALVYDGRLVVDSRFRTNDHAIFAAGAPTKFSRRYAGAPPMGAVSGREAGAKLALSLLATLDPLSPAPPSDEEGGGVPEFAAPVAEAATLPGGLHYLHVAAPGGGKPASELVFEGDGGISVVALDAHAVVASLTYLGPDRVEERNWGALVSLPVGAINNLAARAAEGATVGALPPFLRENWAAALYHDRFAEFREALRLELAQDDDFKKLHADAKAAAAHTKGGGGGGGLAAAELVAALPETKRALVRQRLLDYLGTNQNLLDMYLVPSSAIMKKMEMPILP